MKKEPSDSRSRTPLEVAVQATQSSRYFWSLQVLWPNVQGILARLADYVGDELCAADGDTPVLNEVLLGIKRRLTEAEDSGRIGALNLDRDVLVHFLRAVVREGAAVFTFEAESDGAAWNPVAEGFIPWRLRHPGSMSVRRTREDQGAADPSGDALKAVARQLLSERDWDLLGEDEPRLWSPTGEGPSESRKDNEPQPYSQV